MGGDAFLVDLAWGDSGVPLVILLKDFFGDPFVVGGVLCLLLPVLQETLGGEFDPALDPCLNLLGRELTLGYSGRGLAFPEGGVSRAAGVVSRA